MSRVPPRLQRRASGDPASLLGAGLAPALARVLAARGVCEPSELDLRLQHLLPPDRLLGVREAAERLALALRRDESILVVGDFDADGATSCALALRALSSMGARRVDYLVPNRFVDGYGLSPSLVDIAKTGAPDLLITVDNGIASVDGVAAAHAAGIEVLITDHHLPGEVLPAARYIVNPNQDACAFPSKHLAGAGVIFYVMIALRARLRETGWFDERGMSEPTLADCLDLVALGTVADVVPLDYNNRILVQAGLQRVRAGRACPGILALLAVAGRDPRRITAADLGFAVGPRLNAAGRLEDMSVGIECLLSDDPGVAARLARDLDALNRERREIERGMQDEALQLLDDVDAVDAGARAAVALYDPGWHQGVIGILAARIRERLHRPVVAFADAGDGELKGSARSISGVHIRDVLAAVDARYPGLISRFGGHAMAAGLSLRHEKLEDFSRALDREVARLADPEVFAAVLYTDGELAARDFSLDLAETLREAGPWGQHFPEPVFEGGFEVLSQRLVAERHLKLALRVPDSAAVLEAIAFHVDLEAWPDPGVTWVHLAYRLDVNDYRDQRRVQLVVLHLDKAPPQRPRAPERVPAVE